MAPTDALWDELRRMDRAQVDHIRDSVRIQGEVDEICSRVERLERDMSNVATKNDLGHSRDLISAQLTNLKDSVDPMRKGVYALVWLVISTVIVAGLAFLLSKPSAPTSSPPGLTAPRTPSCGY